MTTAGTAIPGALVSSLEGDATLGALFTGGTAVVYDTAAPKNADFPYIKFSKMGGGPVLRTPSDERTFLYDVVVFSNTSQKEANEIDNAIDEVLHKSNLSISGYTNLWTVRETELPNIVEYPDDNSRIWRSGAIYRITIDD